MDIIDWNTNYNPFVWDINYTEENNMYLDSRNNSKLINKT